MKRRPFVEWVADQMELKLREKDELGYTGWECMTLSQKYEKLKEERREADVEIIDGCTDNLLTECVHEALTAMFVAAHFDEGMSRLKRGFEIR